MNNFASFISDLLTAVSSFLLSEPAIYVVCVFILVMILSIITRLRRG